MTTTTANQLAQSTTNRAVILVCVAHFLSHFYIMLLPPLFPVLSKAMDVGYTELGLAFTVFSLVSGFTQAPMGFLVDKYGPQKILIAGVAAESLVFVLIGITPIYGLLVFLLGIAGIANSVYHPANYTILNNIVPEKRIGRTFSYHTASGMSGEAIAPACILLLSTLYDWRLSLVLCGFLGIAISIVLVLNAKVLGGNQHHHSGKTATQNTRDGIKVLLTLPILMGVVFFIGISVLHRGMTGFSVSALHEGHGLTLGVAGAMLSAWLFASPVGVLVGGRVADKNQHYALTISTCFAVIAFCILSIIFFLPNIWVCGVLFAISGFCSGVVSPSRDMLIRSITPPGQFGKVFGFVSTGFNIGGIIAPPVFGYVLDHYNPDWVFSITALVSILTIFTVFSTHQVAKDKINELK